jgi:hypothetical protein
MQTSGEDSADPVSAPGRLESMVPNEATPRTQADAVPIFCGGVDPTTGRRCRTLVAKVEHGRVVFRSNGFVVVDPPSVQCRSCGTVRVFGASVTMLTDSRFVTTTAQWTVSG